MSATILHFDEHRRRAQQRCGEAMILSIKDSVTQTIMHDYMHLPLATVALAIHAANQAIDLGGGLVGAVIASEDIIQTRCPGAVAIGTQGTQRLEIFLNSLHQHRVSAFLSLVGRQLQYLLSGRPQQEYHLAMVRARRVLDCGGTICAAMYHALGDDWMNAAP